MSKSKYIVLGIFVVIFFTGLGVILFNQSVSPRELIQSLNDLNPRVLSLLVLPLIAALFGLWVLYRKKRQERLWKKALQQTRAKAARRR